jgi:hypothetical protein
MRGGAECRDVPVFYARPAGGGVQLDVAPALASWDKAGSPGQARSAAFIEHVLQCVTNAIARTPVPIALLLDIGVPRSVSLLAFHDLDNYLFPLVPRLTERTGRQFASVWATRRHAAESFVAIQTAVPAADPGSTYSFDVTTAASTATDAYKEQVRDQVATEHPLPMGAVELQLAFVVGPRRAWPNLWKTTIDSLGAIVGDDPGAREWHPQDGRITELGLHCVVDPTAGNEVRIAIRASPAAAAAEAPSVTAARWKRRSSPGRIRRP